MLQAGRWPVQRGWIENAASNARAVQPDKHMKQGWTW